MKPKTEESSSIPPPMAIRYPATGTVPCSALLERGGAAANVRADRDSGEGVTAGGVARAAAGCAPADVAGVGDDP